MFPPPALYHLQYAIRREKAWEIWSRAVCNTEGESLGDLVTCSEIRQMQHCLTIIISVLCQPVLSVVSVNNERYWCCLNYECSALQALRWTYILKASRFFVGHHPPSVYHLTTYDQISQAFSLRICIPTAKQLKTGGGNGLGTRLHWPYTVHLAFWGSQKLLPKRVE